MTRDDDSKHVDAGKNFHHPCYPSTIEFASSPSENRELVVSSAKDRRPGGNLRGVRMPEGRSAPRGPASGLTWKTSSCDGDMGAPHAISDLRSPNPTPLLNIGESILKNLGNRLRGRIEGSKPSSPSGTKAQVPDIEV